MARWPLIVFVLLLPVGALVLYRAAGPERPACEQFIAALRALAEIEGTEASRLAAEQAEKATAAARSCH